MNYLEKYKGYINLVDGILIIISISLFAFVAYKASISSFIHDESLTYNKYVVSSLGNIISLSPPSANNHILNTLLMKLSARCFGAYEFPLRLPNVLAFAGYLFFAVRILKRNSNKYLILPFFILLTVNPYLLDFFSIARGYGLGIFFMVGSIYYLLKNLSGNKQIDLIYSLIFASLSVLSSFVLLYFYFSLIVVYNLDFLFNSLESKRANNSNFFHRLIRHNRSIIIISILLFVTIFEPVRKLINFNQLYAGGNTGFFYDTVLSLSGGYYYGVNYGRTMLFAGGFLIIIILLTAVYTLLYLNINNKGRQVQYRKEFSAKCAVVVVVCCIVVFAHYLFGTKFIRYRMSIFLFPLLFISCHSVANLFSASFKLRRIILPVAYLLSAFAVFNFLNSIKVDSYYEWKYDKNTKNMLAILEKDVVSHYPADSTISLGITWLFEPATNYYKAVDSLHWLRKIDRNGIEDRGLNYFYLTNDDFKKFGNKDSFNIIVSFSDSQSYLIRNKKD